MWYRAIVILAIIAVVVAAGAPAGAQQMRIGVYGEPIVECDFVLAAPLVLGTAHVIVTSSVDFSSVRFKAVVPACNGIIWVSDIVPNGIHLGDSQNGIDITLPGCTSVVPGVGVEILAIQYLVTGSGTEVCEWVVEPFPGDDTIEMIDCDGYVATAAGNGAGQINDSGTCGLVGESNIIAPYRPFPADGDTDVNTEVLLDWVGYGNHIYLADHSFDAVIPGHNHSEDLVWGPTLPGGPYSPPKPFDPGPLEANTTYHWYIENAELFGFHGQYAVSDRWTFTTADVIAAEQTTWGKVKALYQ